MVQLRQRPRAPAHQVSRLEEQQHQRRPAETKGSEEASTTLSSQGPAEGKVESTQASAWPCCPHPHHLEKNSVILTGRVGQGLTKSHLSSRTASCCSPPAGGLLSAVIWRGPAEPRAGETVGGLEVSSSALPAWLGTRGTCSGK